MARCLLQTIEALCRFSGDNRLFASLFFFIFSDFLNILLFYPFVYFRIIGLLSNNGRDKSG